jgi:hypothetical protein
MGSTPKGFAEDLSLRLILRDGNNTERFFTASPIAGQVAVVDSQLDSGIESRR